MLNAGSAERRCILVVDDSHDLRKLLCDSLRREGFMVVDAIDGESALVTAASTLIDGVLTDFEMPGIDGVELCQKLANLDRILGRNTPVWIMTGAPGGAIERKAQAAGAKGLFRKPFNVAHIACILRSDERIISEQPQRSRSYTGLNLQ
jgi:CheY-like chemotaxis protein